MARPFTDAAKDFLEPYQDVLAEVPEARVLKHLVVPITGDRGLCGGINTNVVRAPITHTHASTTTPCQGYYR